MVSRLGPSRTVILKRKRNYVSDAGYVCEPEAPLPPGTARRPPNDGARGRAVHRPDLPDPPHAEREPTAVRHPPVLGETGPDPRQTHDRFHFQTSVPKLSPARLGRCTTSLLSS